MSDKKKLEFRGTLTPEQVRDHLSAIGASMVEGQVVLQSEGRHIVLEAAPSADLEISAEQKKDKAKLSIEISWRLPTQAIISDEGLMISSEAPKPPPPPAVGSTAPAEQDDSDDDS